MKTQKKVIQKKIENDIKISTLNKNFIEIFTLIKEKVNHIQEMIRNTIVSIEKYKKHELFSNSDMNICIYTLTGLYEKTTHIIEKNQSYMDKHISEEYNYSDENIHEIIELLQQTTDRLCAILSNFGTYSLDDLLYVSFGQDFEKDLKMGYRDNILNAKYELLKKYIHPTGYKMINWKNNTCNHFKNNPEKNYCDNKITEEIVVIENANNMECFDMDLSVKNFFYKINGMRVVIHNEKLQRTIIISCIIDDISHDLLSNEYIQYRKSNIMEDLPANTEFENIVTRIADTMTLKDMLVHGRADIYKRYLTLSTDVNSIKFVKLNITIKNFLEMDIFAQRSILMNLLTYNKEDDVQYITYLLYDLLNVHSNESMDSHEQKIIYDSFPWKIKNYFKDTMKMTMKYTQDMISKYDINRISLEQQIYLLKAPENVKEKAIMKLKEIKNKNDDSSVKSKQYLEGLLKIPFGIYRQEPILKLMKDINQSFIQLMSKNATFFKELEYCPKESYTNTEMIKIIHKMETYMNETFIKDIRNKIQHASSKQLTQLIQYIQTLHKANIIGNIQINGIVGAKTKPEKIKTLLEFMDANIQSIYSDPHKNMHFYKIYELLQGSQTPQIQSLVKLPMEIKTLAKNIKDTGPSLNKISQILDDSIYGHFHAKNQILKIIGQWMTGEQSGYCFGFEGSPGIGKTSLAKKGLSNCLKDENDVSRPFSFIALGGSCNGSTLEGHSYTYVNSTWGRIVDILMETKCMNPIIYVDELDKVSKTEHGKEIIGILTHLIDTTQNDVFQDKYYSGIDIDLSKALFIFSYNDPEQIDRILLDRIHRIKFDNLSLEDKKVIVNKYILPEINKKMGFSNIVELSEETVEYIIEAYTLEPGVRKLKELLFDLYGEINIQLLKGEDLQELPILITKDNLDKYLKKYQKIEETKINLVPKVGIINGLWANALGKGGIITIETGFFPSSVFLDLRLTGLQGDVMKESMNVAKTLAWNLTDDSVKARLLETFEKTKAQGLHIHCPDGSVSKDGPSAGTAITVAIYSLLNNKKIKRNIALTGEINLQGQVTAIGGLETKILGGIRAGVDTFLFPDANKNDFTQFQNKYSKKKSLDNITFINVSNIEKVFEYVFEEE